MTAAIEAIDVTRSYQLDGVSVDALRGVSLTIERADYAAIIGPSGSGKSTLMHLMGGLDRPTSGRLTIGGRDVANLTPSELAALRNTEIGFVFQAFHLLPRTTALENVALPLLYSGLPAAERKTRALQRLAEVGLAERIDHTPAELSGGQQQRVAIARGLVNNPSLILADEPTGALDSRTSIEIMALLQTLSRQGMTIVIVTHERDIAAFASRIITFRDGLVISDAANLPFNAQAELDRLDAQGKHGEHGVPA